LIWAALAIYVVDGLVRARRRLPVVPDAVEAVK
jgi:hypothetical protein